MPRILYPQDKILYYVARTMMVAEVLELDIPHPTSKKDTQTYIRVETPVGPKLTTRAEVVGVLCPKCHADPRSYAEGPVELFSVLEDHSGMVSTLTGKKLRHFRFCPECKYFKEAS